MRRRRLLFPCAVASVGLLSLTACGIGIGGSGDSEAEVSGCKIPEANRGTGPIEGELSGEITFQTLGLKGSFADFFEDQIERFEKEHPGAKIKWIDDPGGEEYMTRVATDIKVCNLPDVINTDIQGVIAMNEANLLMDVGDRLPDVADTYPEGTWANMVPPGSDEHVALPWYTGAGVLAVNTELAAEFGLGEPPTSYDEWFEDLNIVAAQSDGSVYGDWGHPLYVNPQAFASVGAQITNADATEFTFGDDPAAIKWLTNMAETYQAGGFPADSISETPDGSEAYAAGQLVYAIANPRYISSNGPEVYEKTEFAPFFFDKAGGPLASGQTIVVPRTSENAALALEFAKFVVSPAEQEAWCADNGVQPIPPSVNLPSDSRCWTNEAYDPKQQQYMDLAREALATAQSQPVTWAWSGAVGNLVASEVQLAMQGKKTPEQALQDAEDAANEALASAG